MSVETENTSPKEPVEPSIARQILISANAYSVYSFGLYKEIIELWNKRLSDKNQSKIGLIDEALKKAKSIETSKEHFPAFEQAAAELRKHEQKLGIE